MTDHARGQQVPVKRTVVSMKDFARAVLACWHLVENQPPSKRAVGVLWAQYAIETGGQNCWNWNVGNVKSRAGDGYDWHALNGVWEGVSPDEAKRLVASGEARIDPSPDHAKAVGAGRVSVIFQPPHPQTRFRAFTTLDEAMEDHIKLVARRFAPAWPHVLAGNVDAFARALKSRGYFTADAGAYARGMMPAFNAFISSSVYEDAQGELMADTEVPPPPSTEEEIQIIHPPVPLGRPALDEE